LVYISVHFVFGTIAFACHVRLNEMMFVTERNFPGGPNAFFVAHQSHWLNIVVYSLYISTAWLQDGLLIWRYFIFWERRLVMLLVPVPLLVVSFVMGILLLDHLRRPGGNVWESASFNLFTTFWAVEISMTIFITTMIVGRLIYARSRLTKTSVRRSYQTQYLTIAAMLIESGLMFSVGGIIFVVSYAYNNPFQNMVLDAVGQIQSIAPLLIILRVAQGNSATQHSSLSKTTHLGHGAA
ncbi:hypothetical protein EXIGLDRAFT_583531, partial [Exidia glandulosa HHB12029]